MLGVWWCGMVTHGFRRGCGGDDERSEDSKSSALVLVSVVIDGEDFACEEAEIVLVEKVGANEGVAWMLVDGYDGTALVLEYGVAGDVEHAELEFAFVSWDG